MLRGWRMKRLATLWELSIEAFLLHKLIERVHLSLVAVSMMDADDGQPDTYIFGGRCLIQALSDLREACDSLELTTSSVTITETIGTIENACENRARGREPDVFHKAIPRYVGEVIQTIRKETSSRLFFYLPHRELQLYSDKKPFGERVWSVFPDAIADAEESAKCLALERATASVFHSLRVVETGIRALWVSMDRTVPKNPNWKELIDGMFTEAAKADDKIARRWRGKQGRLKDILTLLDHVRDASRNPSMHPDKVHTLETAEDVFNTSKAFMRRLSEELDTETPDDAKDEKPENPPGRTDSDPQAPGRPSESAEDRKPEAAQAVNPPPEEEGLKTSPSDRSAGCTAKRIRSDRTEDA